MSPNGRYILNDMEFEQNIRQMNDRQLLEFTARQTYGVCLLAESSEKRIDILERRDRKTFSIIGGLAAFFGAAVVAIINFFLGR